MVYYVMLSLSGNIINTGNINNTSYLNNTNNISNTSNNYSACASQLLITYASRKWLLATDPGALSAR
jgi:hypothetical protein